MRGFLIALLTVVVCACAAVAVLYFTTDIFDGAGGGGWNPFSAPYRDTSFQVSPLSSQTLTVRAGDGDTIEGYFTIRGGADEVKFRIEDPYGVIIYNAGLVYDRHDFRVTCNREGHYTLYFDNSFSWTVGKNVYLHYRVR